MQNLSKDEFRSWLEHMPIFGQNNDGLTYDQFKTVFYPHLTMAGAEQPKNAGSKTV